MISSDDKFHLFPDSANCAQTGMTIAIWDAETRTPHPDYTMTREEQPRPTHDFILQYSSEIPLPPPPIAAEPILDEQL